MSTIPKRDLENLRARLGGDEAILIARCDPVTADLEDFNGNPIDPDDHGADTLIRSRRVLVMDREQAEQEGQTVLGPADVPGDRDGVEVPDDRIKRDEFPGVMSKYPDVRLFVISRTELTV